MRFRHGSEVPGTPYASYKTPEEEMPPDILAQQLSAGYIFREANGALYYNEIDQSKSGERVTGQVIAAEIEPPQTG